MEATSEPVAKKGFRDRAREKVTNVWSFFRKKHASDKLRPGKKLKDNKSSLVAGVLFAAVAAAPDMVDVGEKLLKTNIEQATNDQPPNKKVAEVRGQKVKVGLPPPDNIDQDRSRVATAKPNYQAMKPKYQPPEKGVINLATRNKAYQP